MIAVRKDAVAPVRKDTVVATDLQARVEARKRELIAEIVEHKRAISRAGAVENIERLKARLFDLTHIVKVGVANGWANVEEGAKIQLDEWIAR